MKKSCFLTLCLISLAGVLNANAPLLETGTLHYLENLVKSRAPESAFTELIETYKVVAVFSAPWCGPCKALQPHVETVSKELKNILFIKINTDAFKALTTRYGIRGIPTIICFNKGKMTQFSGGGMNAIALKKKINDFFGPSQT